MLGRLTWSRRSVPQQTTASTAPGAAAMWGVALLQVAALGDSLSAADPLLRANERGGCSIPPW